MQRLQQQRIAARLAAQPQREAVVVGGKQKFGSRSVPPC